MDARPLPSFTRLAGGLLLIGSHLSPDGAEPDWSGIAGWLSSNSTSYLLMMQKQIGDI